MRSLLAAERYEPEPPKTWGGHYDAVERLLRLPALESGPWESKWRSGQLDALESPTVRKEVRIDGGEPPAGVLIFRPKTAQKTAQRPRKGRTVHDSSNVAASPDPLISQAVAATMPLPAKVAELVDAQVSGTCG